jgi:hypothetical protein
MLTASVAAGDAASQPPADGCALAPTFATLRARIGPGFVGSCVEDLHDMEDTADGDTAQSTTQGLFIWHHVTGQAAFTDGRQTWLTGPGLLLWDRHNDERFDWERDSGGGDPVPTGWGAATAPCLPIVEEWRFARDGVAAAVRNSCGAPRVLVLSAVLLDGENGQPIGVTPSVAWGALDGEQRTVLLPARTASAGAAHFLRGAAPPGERPPLHCLDVGHRDAQEARDALEDGDDADHASPPGDAGGTGGHCLAVDPWLAGTVAALAETPGGRELLRAAAAAYVVVRRQAFAFPVYGLHELGRNTVILDQRLDGESDWVRAAYLAHELRHALDDAAGLPFGRGRDCLDRETAAVRAEAQAWRELWRGRLPVARTPAQRDLNDGALRLAVPAQGFARFVAAGYGEGCG